jgi:hypothetical protein
MLPCTSPIKGDVFRSPITFETSILIPQNTVPTVKASHTEVGMSSCKMSLLSDIGQN